MREADPRGFTYSEEWRHECEVRYVLRMPSRAARAEYLDGLARKRGEAAANRMRDDVAKAWHAARVSQQTGATVGP